MTKLKRSLTALALGLALTLATLGMLAVPTVLADGFTVTKTDDTADDTCDADCSLREAISAANANAQDDTITLPAGTFTLTISGTGDDINSRGDLDITSADALTITGAGAGLTIINADRIDRVLDIHNGTVVISGVTIYNGDVNSYGGGIYDHGANLTLINTTVYSNSALINGGGVYVDDGSATLDGTYVISNSSYYGGGIYVNDGSATLTGTHLISNSASSGGGGGICVYSGSATLIGTHVISNSASGGGGGIYVDSGSATLTETHVISNSASSIGGGIFINSGSATLTETHVTGNSASSAGGGIYVNDGSTILTGTHVINNSASNYGGGIYVYSGSVILTGTHVISNSTSNYGGGIYVESGSATLTGTHVTGNSASSIGGGIYVKSGSAMLVRTQVISNSASAIGGGMYVESGSAILTGAHVISNSASSGGGIYVSSGSVILTDTQVISNSASFYGGGIWVGIGRAMLTGTHVTGNSASSSVSSSGGGIYVSSGRVTLTGTHVISNSASSGGGVHVSTGSATLTGTHVISNSASFSGGGIYVKSGSAMLIGTHVISNSASSSSGGGIYVNSGSATLTGTHVISNSASNYGGGIYVLSGSATLTGTHVTGNSAYYYGGGIYVNDGSATLTGMHVTGNSVYYYGGGIYVRFGSAMLTGTHVTGNSASNYGGGIYVNSGSATLTGTQIAANDAPVGSALYNYKGAITSTTALTITGDIYQRDGVFAASGHDLRIEGGLQLAGGDFYATGAPTGTFTLTGPYTHTGGTYHQVKPVDGAIDVGFPKAGGVIVNANGQNLGSTEVADTAGADCAGMTPGDAVQHCYTIRPTIASGRAAAVTFYYQSGELPAGHACVAMEAYHQPGTLGVLLQRDATYGSAGRMCGPEPQSLRVVGVSDFAPFILRGPAVDVRISKSVTPTVADPGQLVTYTLDFSNVGIITATGVVITDSMPVSVSAGSIVSSGAEITQIGPGYVWAVQDLAPGDGGVITITGALPVPLSSGPLTNTVTITTTEIDADGANNSHAAGLTVNDVAPIAGDDAFTVELDSIDNPLTVLDGDSDANGDTLTITAVGTPDSDGTAVNGSTVVTYTPLAGSLGDEVFTYTISDDNGGTDTATVTVTIIEDVNNWPIALSDTFTVDEDSIDNPFDVLSNDFDPDGDTLTISAVGPLNKGGTAVNGGTIITYTPLADFYGVETFTYTIGDGNGGFDTSVVSVIVNQGPVGNNPPVAVDDAAVTAWVTPVTVTVLDNDSDPDSDTITVIAVGAAANGTTAHSTSIVTYTSDPSFTGTDTFTYTISDGEDSDTALVIVNVGQARFIIDADDPTDVTITLPGSCNIRIGAPVGAVPVDMDMLYNAAQAPVARPPNHEFVGCAFTLDAYQGGARQDDLDFDVPISVALTYEATSVVGLSLDDMHLFARNSDSDEWSTDGITRESLDPVARRHSSQVAHLTQFALFAQPEPALRVYKSVDTGGADPLPLGSMVTYTLVISNSTDEVANNVVLTDPLPSGVTFGDWVMYGGSAILPPPEIVNLPPVTVKWSPGDIAAGTAYTLSFTANVVTDTQFAGNTITNTAYVIADNAPLGSDSASFGIIGGGSYIYLPLVLKE